jgi:peptide-methionine (R)-S-oxide reductase
MKRRSALGLLAGSLLGSIAGQGLAQSPAKAKGVTEKDVQDSWKTLLAPGADIAASAAPLQLADDEWKKRLSPPAYGVLRNEDTERAGSSALNGEHRPGVFVCAGCSLPLFSSAMKYESGTEFFHHHPRGNADQARFRHDHSAHRISLQQMRRPPGTRVRRRPAADGTALVQ